MSYDCVLNFIPGDQPSKILLFATFYRIAGEQKDTINWRWIIYWITDLDYSTIYRSKAVTQNMTPFQFSLVSYSNTGVMRCKVLMWTNLNAGQTVSAITVCTISAKDHPPAKMSRFFLRSSVFEHFYRVHWVKLQSYSWRALLNSHRIVFTTGVSCAQKETLHTLENSYSCSILQLVRLK